MTAARDALVTLVAERGSITPEVVVDAARDADSPLHPHFEWDDTIAAEKFRVVQAGRLLRRYKVEITVEPERTIRVRAFTSVPSSDPEQNGPRYMATADALSDEATRDLVMKQAMRDIAALRAKYSALIDFDEALRASIGKRSGRRVA